MQFLRRPLSRPVSHTLRNTQTIAFALSAVIISLIFLVGSSKPARAQYWVVTYTYSNESVTLNGTQIYQNSGPGLGITTLFNYYQPTWPALDNNSNIGSYSGKRTITATAKWVDYNGKPTSNPPKTAYFIQYAHASWTGLQGFGPRILFSNASCSNGLGDPALINPGTGGYWDAISMGSHFIQKDGSSGTIKFAPVTLIASCTAAPNPPDFGISGNAAVYLTYSVTPQTRLAQIQSNLGTTYHRGGTTSNGYPVANVPDKNGTLTNDTRTCPEDDILTWPITHTYYSSSSSYWSPNSAYHWNETLEGFATSGNCSPSSISNFPITYTNNDAFDGSIDHINLHIYDSIYPVNVSGNYYLRFHSPIANKSWTVKKTIFHPQPKPTPILPSLGEWNYFFSQPGGKGMVYNHTETRLTTWSISGSIGGSSTKTDLTATDITNAFAKNMNVTIGYTYTFIAVDAVNVPTPYANNDIYWGTAITEQSGTVDVWGVHGFTGTQPWTLNVPGKGPVGELGVSWAVLPTQPTPN